VLLLLPYDVLLVLFVLVLYGYVVDYSVGVAIGIGYSC